MRISGDCLLQKFISLEPSAAGVVQLAFASLGIAQRQMNHKTYFIFEKGIIKSSEMHFQCTSA